MFETYIKRILKKQDSDVRITTDVVKKIDNFIILLTQNISEATKYLATMCGKKTIYPKNVGAAIKLKIPGDLGKMGDSVAYNRTLKYEDNKKIDNRTKQAGLILSVPRIEKILVDTTRLRLNKYSSVYLTAAIEFVVYELLELCVKHLQKHNKKTIDGGVLVYVLYEDREFVGLLSMLNYKF